MFDLSRLVDKQVKQVNPGRLDCLANHVNELDCSSQSLPATCLLARRQAAAVFGHTILSEEPPASKTSLTISEVDRSAGRAISATFCFNRRTIPSFATALL